jgi:hypothetical protein
MAKTIEKAETTARNAKGTLATGVEDTRRSTADILESIGAGVKRQSRRASRATEKTGRRIGDTLEISAERVRGRPSSPQGYIRRHPMQGLLMFGLMACLIALIAMPLLMSKRTTEDGEFEGYGPF